MSSNSPKASLFRQLKNALNSLKMEYNTEFQAVFFSHIGKIVCDIEPPASKDSLISFTDNPTMFIMDISALFDVDNAFDEHLINAKNVVIYKNNSNEELMRVDQMILFADQIIGFTLVKKS